MTKSFWRKQHKWFGLALCFFLLMFSVSGIILNHRGFYSKVNISRAVLPPYYKYENWNAGLLRGTLRLDSASTLIYGYSGLWLHQKQAASKRPVLGLSMAEPIADFNAGLPDYANYRVIRNVVMLPGWCLRPPLLIPLALNKMPGIPHTAISPADPWKDKLRAIRYDEAQGDWLLSTSDGFFSLEKSLQGQPMEQREQNQIHLSSAESRQRKTKGQPKAIPHAPHISVMGINVLQKDSAGHWLVGSLSGMWRWDRAKGRVTDYFTAEPMPEKAGSPFGKTPVSGFSADFGKPFIVEYYDGVNGKSSITIQPSEQPNIPKQPAELRNLPMSLWQLALEIHTGRLYNLFGLAPLIWIFLTGLAAIWVLISGWKLRH